MGTWMHVITFHDNLSDSCLDISHKKNKKQIDKSKKNYKTQGGTKGEIRGPPKHLETIRVFKKFHENPHNSSNDISVCIKVVDRQTDRHCHSYIAIPINWLKMCQRYRKPLHHQWAGNNFIQSCCDFLYKWKDRFCCSCDKLPSCHYKNTVTYEKSSVRQDRETHLTDCWLMVM